MLLTNQNAEIVACILLDVKSENQFKFVFSSQTLLVTDLFQQLFTIGNCHSQFPLQKVYRNVYHALGKN